jgi:FAD/FMN-containing dehydrogenase
MATALASFGRVFPPAPASIKAAEAIKRLKTGEQPHPDSLLAYGNGRSYGDSCLNSNGALIDMRAMDRILGFDASTGILEAEAGTMLSDIIAHAAPLGFFPQVVPGTQFVTLAGAIANDVHGKNHHRRGTFGRHVEAFKLLRSDGSLHHCTPTRDARLFEATIGGMGLTGVILSASIRLMRVESLDIDERVAPFRNLGEFFELIGEADANNEYVVAWLDQLASGKHAGRGLLMTGNHARHGSRAAQRAGSRLAVPFQPPVNLLSRPFLKLFNAAYRSRKSSPKPAAAVAYQGFFFPLDGVRDWNRLYGPRGLYQHQSVVPEPTARAAIAEMLDFARSAGQGSFLTVLKRLGPMRSPGFVSFPRAGYTLTLDFPNKGKATLDMLAGLDRITIEAGGAVNPYKDARMSAQTFAASFPDWRMLEAVRDPAFMSDFWARTARQLPCASQPQRQAAE